VTRGRQGQTPILGVEPISSPKGSVLLQAAASKGVAAQLRVVVDILIPQGQAIEPLASICWTECSTQLGCERLEALGQRPGQPQVEIHLAE